MATSNPTSRTSSTRAPGIDKFGGYPLGTKPRSQLKPPAGTTRPRPPASGQQSSAPAKPA